MNAVLTLTRSTIGKKIVMAVTGAILTGWLTVHMLGNMQVFLGRETLDHYGELIQSQKELLWLMRSGMLVTLLLHIWSIISLVQVSAKARPVGYQGGRQTRRSTLATRSMRIGGVVLLGYLIFHLLDLTVGLPAVNSAFKHGAVYDNLTYSLRRPGVAALYIAGSLALGLHLRHGVTSLFQTLGLNQIGSRATAEQAGTFLAVLVAGGNILITLAIVSGFVGTVTP